jgi:hypothetical protein
MQRGIQRRMAGLEWLGNERNRVTGRASCGKARGRVRNALIRAENGLERECQRVLTCRARYQATVCSSPSRHATLGP